MAKRNTQGRRDAEERAQKIRAAEEAAVRAHAEALARVEAEGLWAAVERAQAARIPVEADLLALGNDMVRHFRACAGRLAEPWPHSAALRAAEETSRELEAAYDAAVKKWESAMHPAKNPLWRLLILKAAAQDDARAARGRGGKTSAETRAKDFERIREEAAKVRAGRQRRLSEEEVAEKIGETRKTLRRAHGKST